MTRDTQNIFKHSPRSHPIYHICAQDSEQIFGSAQDLSGYKSDPSNQSSSYFFQDLATQKTRCYQRWSVSLVKHSLAASECTDSLITYGEIISIVSSQKQIFPSLIQVSRLLLSWGLSEAEPPPPATAKILYTAQSACEQHDTRWRRKGEVASHPDSPVLESFALFYTYIWWRYPALPENMLFARKHNQRGLLIVNSSFLSMQTSLFLPWDLKCKYLRKDLFTLKIQNKRALFSIGLYPD